MADLGLAVLGRAICEAAFSSYQGAFSDAVSVMMAAHGAEMVVKSRIAKEHPLLVFSALPKSTKTKGSLDIPQLFEDGRTLDYKDLPEHLWAATGLRMEKKLDFLAFGRLRNKIAHFAVPDEGLAHQALVFIFEVMEPLLAQFGLQSAASHAIFMYEHINEDGSFVQVLQDQGISLHPATEAALVR